MKKLLFALLLSLLFVETVKSQRYIIDQFMSFTLEEDEWIVDTETKEIFVVTAMDIENKIHTIYSKNTQSYQFVKEVTDYNDDPERLVSYLALDQDDDLCIFHYYYSKESDLYSFHIEYGDFIFIYFLKKNQDNKPPH